MKRYYTRLDILAYLERCSLEMTKEELHREIIKLKNFIEENDIASLRTVMASQKNRKNRDCKKRHISNK